MGAEEPREQELDRLGNEPLRAPPAEQLEEENPVESPARTEEGKTRTERDSVRERAASSMEPARPTAKSTEGLTVGGTEKAPPQEPDPDDRAPESGR